MLLPAFLSVIALILAADGAGAAINRLLKLKDGILGLAFGLLFLSLLVPLFSLLGLLGKSLPFQSALAVLALCGLVHRTFHWREWRIPRDELLNLLPALVLFAVVLRCAVFLNVGQDAYNYHLMAPLHWWLSGGIQFLPELPNIYIASYWEYLFTWGFALLGAEGDGLIRVQLFGQLLHALLGFGGCLLVLRRILLLDLFRAGRWTGAALVTALIPSALLWVSWYAKNDYGAAFWLLAALWLLLRETPAKKEWLLAGVLAGAALAAKFSLFFSVFWAAALLIFAGHFSRRFLWSLPTLLLAAAPILARNFLATDNPFFPFYNHAFGGRFVSESIQFFSFHELLGQGKSLGPVQYLVLSLAAMASEANLLLVVAGAAALGFVRGEKRLLLLCLTALPTILFASFLLSGAILQHTQFRLLGPALMLPGLVGMIALKRFSEAKLNRQPLILRWLPLIVSAIFLLSPHLPWPSFATAVPEYRSFLEEKLLSGKCKFWALKNIPGPVLLYEEDSLYFTPAYVSAFHFAPLDKEIRNLSDAFLVAERSRAHGFRYAIQTRYEEGNFYYPSKNHFWSFSEHPAVLFRGADCYVLDLEKFRP